MRAQHRITRLMDKAVCRIPESQILGNQCTCNIDSSGQPEENLDTVVIRDVWCSVCPEILNKFISVEDRMYLSANFTFIIRVHNINAVTNTHKNRTGI
jgi:hypothetical protein